MSSAAVVIGALRDNKKVHVFTRDIKPYHSCIQIVSINNVDYVMVAVSDGRLL